MQSYHHTPSRLTLYVATLEYPRGAVGEWARYESFIPEDPTEYLQKLNVGDEVISSDAVRTGAQGFTGGLVDIISCANPADR